MNGAYLGLGSNVGDRLANLRAAVDRLAAVDGIEVLATSSVYETEPVGDMTAQPDFYNAAVRVETTLEPRALLGACKRIERELGRTPGASQGPRPIDVDVLLLHDVELSVEGLTLPHPEITSRRFVLEPLLELDPGLSLPSGTPLRAQLTRLGSKQRVKRIGDLAPK